MPMSEVHPNETPPTRSGLTRRKVLRSGGLGALTAVFLAACGADDEQVGLSGPAPSTSVVAPTVPVTEPTDTTLSEDIVQRSTLSSIELLLADVYEEWGPKLNDLELETAAPQFALDHRAAAAAIRQLGKVNDEANKPNEFLKTSLIEPKTDTLTSAKAVVEFLADLESALVATYLNAVGILIEMDQRRAIMGYGAAAARRVGALRPGTGGADGEAFYPLVDLVPADAFVGRPEVAEG